MKRIIVILAALLIIAILVFPYWGRLMAQETEVPIAVSYAGGDSCLILGEWAAVIVTETGEHLNFSVSDSGYLLEVPNTIREVNLIDGSDYGYVAYIMYRDGMCTVSFYQRKDFCATAGWSIAIDPSHPEDVLFYMQGEYLTRFISGGDMRSLDTSGYSQGTLFVQEETEGANTLLITYLNLSARQVVKIEIDPASLYHETQNREFKYRNLAPIITEPYAPGTPAARLFQGDYTGSPQVMVSWNGYTDQNKLVILLTTHQYQRFEKIEIDFQDSDTWLLPCYLLPEW